MFSPGSGTTRGTAGLGCVTGPGLGGAMLLSLPSLLSPPEHPTTPFPSQPVAASGVLFISGMPPLIL